MSRATFSSELKYLSQMLTWVSENLARKGLDPKEIRRIELATEEALVNVIQHAYKNQIGKIEIDLKIEAKGVEISIRDWGIAVNPLLLAPAVNQEAGLEQREIGGLGIYLMHQIMDEIVYQREGKTNLLRLVKHFSQKK